MFGAGIRLTARSLTRPGLLLSPRSSILQSFPLINQRWMSSTNSKSSKTAESAESSLFEPLKDAEDKNFLPFQIPTEVALDTDSTKPLPNTRGHFREQICRTPMMKTGVKKLNQLAFLIKGLDVDQAILQLMFCKRDDAVEVIWALQEGARIAKEIQMMEPSNLFVAYTYLCRGSYYKKIDIKGRGRMGRIRSPETYMVIMLREKAARVLNQRPKPKDIRVPFPNPRKPINNPRIKI